MAKFQIEAKPKKEKLYAVSTNYTKQEYEKLVELANKNNVTINYIVKNATKYALGNM